MKKQKDLIAYSLPNLAFGYTLDVKNSANAWWMDQAKVHMLMAAFQIRATIQEACLHAGITEKQYKYFVQHHPVFTEIRKGLLLIPGMHAKIAISKAIKAGDMKTIWWFASKTMPEFGARVRDVYKVPEIPSPEIQEAIEVGKKAYNDHRTKQIAAAIKVEAGKEFTW